MKKPSYVVNSIHIISLIIWKKVKLKHFKTWLLLYPISLRAKKIGIKQSTFEGLFLFWLSVPIDA